MKQQSGGREGAPEARPLKSLSHRCTRMHTDKCRKLNSEGELRQRRSVENHEELSLGTKSRPRQ